MLYVLNNHTLQRCLNIYIITISRIGCGQLKEQEDSYMVSMTVEMRHLEMRDRLRRGRGWW